MGPDSGHPPVRVPVAWPQNRGHIATPIPCPIFEHPPTTIYPARRSLFAELRLLQFLPHRYASETDAPAVSPATEPLPPAPLRSTDACHWLPPRDNTDGPREPDGGCGGRQAALHVLREHPLMQTALSSKALDGSLAQRSPLGEGPLDFPPSLLRGQGSAPLDERLNMVAAGSRAAPMPAQEHACRAAIVWRLQREQLIPQPPGPGEAGPLAAGPACGASGCGIGPRADVCPCPRGPGRWRSPAWFAAPEQHPEMDDSGHTGTAVATL